MQGIKKGQFWIDFDFKVGIFALLKNTYDGMCKVSVFYQGLYIFMQLFFQFSFLVTERFWEK